MSCLKFPSAAVIGFLLFSHSVLAAEGFGDLTKMVEDQVDPCVNAQFAARNPEKCRQQQQDIDDYNRKERERQAKARAKYGAPDTKKPCDDFRPTKEKLQPLQYPKVSRNAGQAGADAGGNAIPVSVLTTDDARRLVEITKRLKAEKLMLKAQFTKGQTCAPRAQHAACFFQNECKINSAKVFVENSERNFLNSKTIDYQFGSEPGEFYSFDFHVANLFYIQNEGDPEPKLYVMDLLYNPTEMVPYEAWLGKMRQGRKENGKFVSTPVDETFMTNNTYGLNFRSQNHIGQACKTDFADVESSTGFGRNRALQHQYNVERAVKGGNSGRAPR